jgi:hypothetical protein
MTRIVVEEDCGNAPKKQVLRDFNIAIAEQNTAQILDPIADTICWEIVGEKRLEGKEQVEEAIAQMMQSGKMSELILRNIMTHGTVGAVDGIATYENGERVAFCEVYRFTSGAKNAKIKEITSYRIKL